MFLYTRIIRSMFTYGRFGRKGPATLTGDGILNFLTGDDARFTIVKNCTNTKREFSDRRCYYGGNRRIFESLWNSGKTPVFTEAMETVLSGAER